jgi:hypothetical protein
MSITICTNNVSGYDTVTGTVEFSLEVEDDKVSRLTVNTFVTLDGLDELFEAIREGVRLMDKEKIVGEA